MYIYICSGSVALPPRTPHCLRSGFVSFGVVCVGFRASGRHLAQHEFWEPKEGPYHMEWSGGRACVNPDALPYGAGWGMGGRAHCLYYLTVSFVHGSAGARWPQQLPQRFVRSSKTSAEVVMLLSFFKCFMFCVEMLMCFANDKNVLVCCCTET